MDLRSVINIEVEKDGHKFVLYLPATSSHGAAYDAIYEMLLKIKEMSDESLKDAAPKKEVAPKKEDSNEEE